MRCTSPSCTKHNSFLYCCDNLLRHFLTLLQVQIETFALLLPLYPNYSRHEHGAEISSEIRFKPWGAGCVQILCKLYDNLYALHQWMFNSSRKHARGNCYVWTARCFQIQQASNRVSIRSVCTVWHFPWSAKVLSTIACDTGYSEHS